MRSSHCEAVGKMKDKRAGRMLIWTLVLLVMVIGMTACSSGGIFAKATETPTSTPTLPPTSTPEPTATEVPPTNTPEPTATKTPVPSPTVNPNKVVMADLAEQLEADGHLISTEGFYKRLPTYDDSWAQINWFTWTPTGEEPDAFVLRTDVTWDSASTAANHFNTGCGFVFNEEDQDNFYMVYLGLDGEANMLRVKGGWIDAHWHKHYGKVGNPQGGAEFVLAVQDHTFTFLVDGEVALTVTDAKINGQKLGITINSGTNKSFGTRCRMEDIDLWTLR
jgi:hypothetical protein